MLQHQQQILFVPVYYHENGSYQIIQPHYQNMRYPPMGPMMQPHPYMQMPPYNPQFPGQFFGPHNQMGGQFSGMGGFFNDPNNKNQMLIADNISDSNDSDSSSSSKNNNKPSNHGKRNNPNNNNYQVDEMDSPKISKSRKKYIIRKFNKNGGGGAGGSNRMKKKNSAQNNAKKISHSKRIKNCPRYIIKQIIRSMKDFPKIIETLCENYGVDYEALVNYFTTNIETFTNFNMIQLHWIANENDATEQARRNLIFRKYSKFFLEEKAIRYILLRGVMKKENKKYYLYTVRHMLKHIDHPETYRSNFF